MRSGTGTETIDKGARGSVPTVRPIPALWVTTGHPLPYNIVIEKRCINGAGVQHRMSIGRSSVTMDRRIREQGYPPDDSVLGHICNMASGFNGRCPYERAREQAR